MGFPFRLVSEDENQGHVYVVLDIDPLSDWRAQLAAHYRALRTATEQPIQPVSLDGVRILSVSHLQGLLENALIPEYSEGNFNVVRSDFGETLSYIVLTESYDTKFAYKSVRDRETIQLPGRGIDALGIEEGERLTLVVGETKVSDQAVSPPHVVDQQSDGLRNQHLAHMGEHDKTFRKIWDCARRAKTPQDQAMWFRVATFFQEKRWDHLDVVACSVLVRPQGLFKTTDFGTFKKAPTDFKPAKVRFIVICIPSDLGLDIDVVIQEWHNLVVREEGQRE